MITQRHYCGELLNVQFFFSHGETITAFFSSEDKEGLDPIDNCEKCSEALDIDFMGMPYLVDYMPLAYAEKISKHKFCSNCWGGAFDIIKADDIFGQHLGYRVICQDCEEETQGYVSGNWVTHCKADDRIYARNTIDSISEALGIESPIKFEKHSREETMKMLGFY